MKIQLLHGFLGQPCDWRDWQVVLSDAGYQNEAIDLWSYLNNNEVSLENFAAAYQKDHLQDPAILIGYSMGGRLALEVAKYYPEKVKALVLFSTQVVSPVSHKEREKWEDVWQEKWLSGEWDNVVSQWNAQEVFSGSKDIARNEADFNRRFLAAAIESWSISKQVWTEQNFPKIPMLWLVGGDDSRMLRSQDLITQLSRSAEICSKPNSGHRFVFERNDKTTCKTLEFLKKHC